MDPGVPDEIVERLRLVCLGLPEAYEEQAWTGTRWRIGRKTFAHVVAIDSGWPPAYARAAGTEGPAVVITFRSSGAELNALGEIGLPYFRPGWFPEIAGIVLNGDTNWDDVAEFVTESYRLLAPKRWAGGIEEPEAVTRVTVRAAEPGDAETTD